MPVFCQIAVWIGEISPTSLFENAKRGSCFYSRSSMSTTTAVIEQWFSFRTESACFAFVFLFLSRNICEHILWSPSFCLSSNSLLRRPTGDSYGTGAKTQPHLIESHHCSNQHFMVYVGQRHSLQLCGQLHNRRIEQVSYCGNSLMESRGT